MCSGPYKKPLKNINANKTTLDKPWKGVKNNHEENGNRPQSINIGTILVSGRRMPGGNWRGDRHTDVMVVAEAHPYFQDARAFLCQDWQMAPEYTHLWDLCNPDAV